MHDNQGNYKTIEVLELVEIRGSSSQFDTILKALEPSHLRYCFLRANVDVTYNALLKGRNEGNTIETGNLKDNPLVSTFFLTTNETPTSLRIDGEKLLAHMQRNNFNKVVLFRETKDISKYKMEDAGQLNAFILNNYILTLRYLVEEESDFLELFLTSENTKLEGKLNSRIDTVNNTVREVKTSLEQAKANIQTLNTQVQGLTEKVNTTKTTTEEVKNNLEKLKETSQTTHNETVAMLRDIQNTLNNHASTLTAKTTKETEMTADIQRVNAAMQVLRTTTDNINTTIEALTTKVDRAEQTNKNQATNIVALFTKKDEAEARITALENRNAEIEARLNPKIEEIKGKTEANKQDINLLKIDTNTTKVDISNLTAKVQEIKIANDTNTQDISTLKNDISLLKARPQGTGTVVPSDTPSTDSVYLTNVINDINTLRNTKLDTEAFNTFKGTTENSITSAENKITVTQQALNAVRSDVLTLKNKSNQAITQENLQALQNTLEKQLEGSMESIRDEITQKIGEITTLKAQVTTINQTLPNTETMNTLTTFANNLPAFNRKIEDIQRVHTNQATNINALFTKSREADARLTTLEQRPTSSGTGNSSLALGELGDYIETIKAPMSLISLPFINNSNDLNIPITQDIRIVTPHAYARLNFTGILEVYGTVNFNSSLVTSTTSGVYKTNVYKVNLNDIVTTKTGYRLINFNLTSLRNKAVAQSNSILWVEDYYIENNSLYVRVRTTLEKAQIPQALTVSWNICYDLTQAITEIKNTHPTTELEGYIQRLYNELDTYQQNFRST